MAAAEEKAKADAQAAVEREERRKARRKEAERAAKIAEAERRKQAKWEASLGRWEPAALTASIMALADAHSQDGQVSELEFQAFLPGKQDSQTDGQTAS